jgi:hypothetical protein
MKKLLFIIPILFLLSCDNSKREISMAYKMGWAQGYNRAQNNYINILRRDTIINWEQTLSSDSLKYMNTYYPTIKQIFR